MLPESVWAAVLLHALLVPDSRWALGRFPELSLVVSLCELNGPQTVPFSPSSPWKSLFKMKPCVTQQGVYQS